MEIHLYTDPEPEPQQDEFWPFPKQTKDLPGEPEFNLENFEDAPL